jgi:urease accessory protein
MRESGLIRAHSLISGGAGAARTVRARLGYDDRHRRRLVVETSEGERVLLDLGEATRLRDGDRLAMDDGRVLVIEAEDEPVADILASDAHALARLAWHLGNRHTPTAVLADRLRIRRDHVLEAMVERLGARVEHREAPFDPEVGAYHDGGGHGHHHHHDEDHGGHGHAH